MDCPHDCRLFLRQGRQKVVIKDVRGNEGDVGVRRLYNAAPGQVYRAAMWVKVEGIDGFYSRLTIAAYGDGGKKPLQFECDRSVDDTSSKFVKVVIGSDSDEPNGPAGCVLPSGTKTIWFKFRGNAPSEDAYGSIAIDRIWFVRCPNSTEGPGTVDDPGAEDGGCRASEDSPD